MKDSQAIVTPLGVSGVSIKLDSPEWFGWLSERSSFSYQSAISDYTCNKRSNGKWYASKRKGDRSQGSKSLAQEYLGSGDKVTKTKLEEIARKFALPDRDYWYLKHPKPKPGEPTASPGAGCTAKGTTKSKSSSQTADEIAKLKAEFEQSLAELQTQLKERNQQLADTITQKEKLEGKAKAAEALAIQQSKEISRLDAKLAEALTRKSKPIDPATLFNQLRPLLNRLSDRERRAIQQKLVEIVDT